MVACLRACDEYRLGDLVSGYWRRHFALPGRNLTDYVCGRWPGSVGCTVLRRQPTSALPEGVCAALPRVAPANETTLVVHLRLGDVLDWPYYREVRGCTAERGCYYVRPLSYYGRVPVPPAVRTVVLVGDPTYRAAVHGAARSLAYRRAVAETFARRGYAVAVRPPAFADDDLAFLVASRHLLPGRGGFAHLATRCRSGKRDGVPTRQERRSADAAKGQEEARDGVT